jgi:hypothetical protein
MNLLDKNLDTSSPCLTTLVYYVRTLPPIIHRHLHSHKVLVKIKKLHEKLHLFTAIREQLTREKTSDDMPGKRRLELFHSENISDKTQGTAQNPSHRE